MSSPIMQYSSAGINQLLTEMQTYQGQLQGQEDDAKKYATDLDNVWEGDGKDQFDAKHAKLMGDLDNVIGILAGGVKGVNDALHNALIADGKVAASF